MRSDVIVDMPGPPLQERRIDGLAGLPTLVVGVVAFVVGIGIFGQLLSGVIEHRRSAAIAPLYLGGLLLVGFGMAAIRGLIAVAPGEARVFNSSAATPARSEEAACAG